MIQKYSGLSRTTIHSIWTHIRGHFLPKYNQIEHMLRISIHDFSSLYINQNDCLRKTLQVGLRKSFKIIGPENVVNFSSED